MTLLTWRRCLGAGGLLGAAYVFLPGRPATDVVWLVALAGTCTAMASGIRRHRPHSGRPWWLLFGGFLLLLGSNLLRFPLWEHAVPYWIGVTGSLLAYSTVAVASLGLVRAQSPGHDREGAIDGAIVMIALATLLAGTVLAPEAFGESSTVLERLLMVAPPLIVSATVAVTLRLLFGGSVRLLSAWLLVVAGVAALAGNVVRMMLAAAGAYERGSWPDVLLLLACVTVATAALHPSMAGVAEPACESSRRPTHARLAVLAVALLAGPGSLLVSRPGAEWALPVFASLTLSLLVFWRLAGLVIEREAVRSELHARAARQEALARIGRHALGDDDLDALFVEATDITARLLGLTRCEVVAADARRTVGEGTVVLPLGDAAHASTRLVATSAQPWSDEDRAFLQSVANVLAGALERHRTQELMRRRALHDPLTELPNRSKLRDHLAGALSRAATDRSTVALLFVDLDGFKSVNDQLGHQAGDELLVAVARRLSRTVRPPDTLARLAGDEFVVVCEHSSRADAGAIAERVGAVLAGPFALSTGHARLGASIGVALSEGSGDVDRLLSEADTAMYRAKERSGCSVAFFDEDLRRRASRRLRIEADLGDAVARGELHLRYRPLGVLGGPAEAVGVEAVPAWRHPREGPVDAAEFLPLAESNGVIVPLGEWVVREACAELARWPGGPPGGEGMRLLVAVTAKQLAEPTLPAHVARVLAETGLEPARLCLGIADQAPLDQRRARVLAELRASGVRLALGGLGHSLAGLAAMGAPGPDVVTIDVRPDAPVPRRTDRALIAAATGIAGELGVQVLAPIGDLGALGAACPPPTERAPASAADRS